MNGKYLRTVEGKNWRQYVQLLIMILCGVIMLSVWPICLVRRNTPISSNMMKAYLSTEQYLMEDAPLKQTFTALETKLESIEFALEFKGELPEGELQFELYNGKGDCLAHQDINSVEMEDGVFYRVDISKWIRKGEEYTFCISVPQEMNGLIKGLYSAPEEGCYAGNLNLFVGDEYIDGYAITRYGYGYPLNIKNIICLWAFVFVCGALLYSLMDSHGKENEDAGCEQSSGLTSLRAQARVGWNAVWRLVDKLQIPILLLELLGILLVTAYICRVTIVDWDEAYSLRMMIKFSFVDMIRETAADIHPPLYYVLLRIFSSVFGTSIFTLKMLSVLFTGGTMLLGITKIRKHWGFETAFLFNLIVGMGPQFIAYSINIRMYSLSLLLVTLCAILAYEIIRGEGKWNWIFFVLTALAGVYTHYFNVVPLAFIYVYLLVGLMLENRRACKYFWISCVATVVGYLPWLGVVVQTLGRAGVPQEGVSVSGFEYGDLFSWAFSTNIEYSMLMPLLLAIICSVILWVERKRRGRQEKLFLIMCVGNLLFTYMGCRIVTSMTARFWDNRYVFASLGLFWLFFIIICSKKGKSIFIAMVIWMSIIAASALVIQKTRELDADVYVQDARRVLEQVADEEVVLYNYSTYHVLYGAHLREQEFIFIDDVEWEKLEKDYIYFIAWGGHWFDKEVIEKYQLQVQECGTMRFEEGVAGVQLYKVVFNTGENL